MPPSSAASPLLLRALRRWWWLSVGTAALCAGSAALFAARETPRYRATAAVAVAPAPILAEADDVIRGLEALERRTVVATFARIPTTREVRTAAATALGLGAEGLRAYHIDAAVVPGTNVIRISAEGADGTRAAHAANAVARVTAAEAQRMYPTFMLRDLEAAVPARHPIGAGPRRAALVGALLGLFLGLAAALAHEAVWPARSPANDPLWAGRFAEGPRAEGGA